MNARFLTSTVAVALLTACGSEYQPYTTQPLPPDGPGTPTTHTLLVEAGSGTGAGTVTGTGVSCSISGTSQSSDCTENFAAGTEVTLTATPAAGSLFVGWGDACASSGTNAACKVLMDRQLRVLAGFGPVPSYQVTVAAGAGSTGTGTVTAAGINCVITATVPSQDCSESHLQGTSVTFTAAPTGGSTFLGWGDACASAGSSTTCTVSVTQEVRVSASFAAPPSYTVTVTADAGSTGNGTVSATGINCVVTGTSVSQDCSEAYVQGTTVTLTATPTGNSEFLQWGGACASAGTNAACAVTITQPLTISASFAAGVAPPPPTHTLAVQAGASGSASGSVTATGISCFIDGTTQSGDCSESFNEGTSVTLTATPTGSNTFLGWGGACAGTSSTCAVTMTQARAVTASFAPPASHTLTVQAGASGTASGSVTATGINCSIDGVTQSGDCSESFDEGTGVTLTATPTGNNTFLGWGGACSGTSSTCMVTMSQARTVTASFAPPPSHVLTVEAGPTSTGTGTATATGINCALSGTSESDDCGESFVEGTSVTLTATPTGGSTFEGWGGACMSAGTTTTCTVTMTQALTVTASFTAPPPPNLEGFWSGTDDAGHIHYHVTIAQSGSTLSLQPSCTPGDCRLIALTSTGASWLGASFVDITSLSGTVTGSAVTFTMTAGSAGAVTFTGTVTSSTGMRGEVSSATMPKQNLTLGDP